MIPLTVADAAAAIMAGELGLVETIRIGSLMISALRGVDGALELNVTERSIQAGFEMTLAARERPSVFNLDIALTNPDYTPDASTIAALVGSGVQFFTNYYDAKDELIRMHKEKEIVEFQTHDQFFESYVVQRIAPYYDVNENWDCYFANVTMKKVKVNQDVILLAGLPDLMPWISGGAL